jgi:hypothetical protein
VLCRAHLCLLTDLHSSKAFCMPSKNHRGSCLLHCVVALGRSILGSNRRRRVCDKRWQGGAGEAGGREGTLCGVMGGAQCMHDTTALKHCVVWSQALSCAPQPTCSCLLSSAHSVSPLQAFDPLLLAIVMGSLRSLTLCELRTQFGNASYAHDLAKHA